VKPWEAPLTGGPDAHRYMALARGERVPRPFHLRWLLPTFLGESRGGWWAIWLMSWPVLAGGMIVWRFAAGDDWRVVGAATVFLVALPGILGPSAVIPVGVDLPATALSLCGVGLLEVGGWSCNVVGLALIGVAAMIRETSPVWSALWLWSPLPLVVLPVVVVRHMVAKTGPDPLGPRFDEIAAHPIKAALAAHVGRWRDGWLMVAPWGACLAGLIRPSVALVVVLVLAYAQLLIATDTVRLVHHAAGPVLAVAAAQTIPMEWLLLACVLHVVWFWQMERV